VTHIVQLFFAKWGVYNV